MPVIEVHDLSKYFGKLKAVDKVSFQVDEGEIFGFLGPNGAGKTTTINILCTLLSPTSGTATINGFDIVKQRADVRRSIGLVFQDPTMDEYLTAEQNLRFHAYAYKIPAAIREKRITELLTRHDPHRRYFGSSRNRHHYTGTGCLVFQQTGIENLQIRNLKLSSLSKSKTPTTQFIVGRI